MLTRKQEKIINVIKEVSAKFLQEQSDATSMITVTDCDLSNDLRQATIYISVFPEQFEDRALEFARRKLSELRDYLKKKSRLGIIPFFEIKIDLGEKGRQKMDEAFRQIKN